LKQKNKEHEDWVAETGKLQLRLEEQVQELRGLRSELQGRDKTIMEGAIARERQLKKIESITAERNKLREDLQASKELFNGAPDRIRQIEQVRIESEAISKENNNLRERLQSQAAESDFLRERYQEASTAASKLTSDLNEMTEARAILEKQADEVTVKLRELNMNEERQQYQTRIRSLEAQLDERNDHIKRLDLEKKKVDRMRGLTTRSSSVPRQRGSPTPSMSQPASPSQNPSIMHTTLHTTRLSFAQSLDYK